LIPALRTAEAILHAGDVCVSPVLDELACYATVHVVMGNNDGPGVRAWGASDTVELDLAGVRVGMIHDSGPSGGRGKRMRRVFPGADVVVFGHSHIPLNADVDGLRLFNPGSPTDRRRQPVGTYGVLELEDGVVRATRIVSLSV
jgi:putative phosphoesterase